MSMRTYLSILVLTCLISIVYGQENKNKTYKLIIAGYTNDNYVSIPANDGIYVYDFNSQTGDYLFKSKIAGEGNPSYLAVSENGKYVYSLNEFRNGEISAFSFNATSGELTNLNRVSSAGDNPCYVDVDDKNRFVFVSNYGSGNLIAVALKEDGSLSNSSQVIQQEGSSINKGRQQGPHVHSALLSPDDQYLLTPNLGTDKVCIYKVDANNKSQPLSPAHHAFVSVKAGSGPRHLAFHPNSRFLYLIQEMESMITVFEYKDGKLTEKQTITMLSPDFKGQVGAADIHVSPDGKFLYGSNRGDANEIVIYAIDNDGKLSYAGRQSILGKTPRNFAIDPSGNFLLSANQMTDEVVIFKRDQKTGLLAPTGKTIKVSRPVCLKFVEVN
jgi:6-phosphogluconolactonase